jgi:predicted dehydrogenase
MAERVASENPVAIGIIGAGVISEIYLQNLINRFAHTHVVGVADIIPEAAKARADQFGVEALTVDELLAHPEIELVLNLTIPAAHAEVALRAVDAGKSVFNEKPLAITREEGKSLLEAANAKGVRVGAAPDTFLGGGLQTARQVIDSGAIGEPVAASALMLNHGMESWHPNPYFFFQPGAGPLFDIGPYYLTALTSILGPVTRVTSFARASFPERTVGSGPKKGEKIPVNTPTHIVSSLEFASGVLVHPVVRRLGHQPRHACHLRHRWHPSPARSEHLRRPGPDPRSQEPRIAGRWHRQVGPPRQ